MSDEETIKQIIRSTVKLQWVRDPGGGGGYDFVEKALDEASRDIRAAFGKDDRSLTAGPGKKIFLRFNAEPDDFERNTRSRRIEIAVSEAPAVGSRALDMNTLVITDETLEDMNVAQFLQYLKEKLCPA